MPGVICNLEGITAILFHVEHSGDTPWQYRWRIVGDYPAPYLVWRENTARGKFAALQAEIRDCLIEVEWREVDSAAWLPVSLLLLATPTARFAVTRTGSEAFTAPSGFTALSIVRDHGVAAYHFPAMELEPGETIEVHATADAPALANVLLESGEFRPRIPGLTITNLAPTDNAWTEVPHLGCFRLARCPLAGARRLWAYGSDNVDPALLAESAGYNGSV